MEKVRARRLIIGTLTCVLSVTAALWYFLPQLLERGVPLLAAQFGIRSDSLKVTAASPWSISLGPLRQCYRGVESSVCVVAASAELRFSWSITARTARADLIRLHDAAIHYTPEAALERRMATPPAPFVLPGSFPELHIEFVGGAGAQKLDPIGRSFSLQGELRTSGNQAAFRAVAAEPHRAQLKAAGVVVLEPDRLQLREGELEVVGERIAVEGTMRVAREVGIDATLRHARSSINATLSGSAAPGLDSGSMRLSLRLGPLPFSGSAVPVPSLRNLVLQSGELDATVTGSWGKGAAGPVVDVVANDLSGSFGPCTFEKLSGTIKPLTETRSTVRLPLLKCGLELRDLRGEIGVRYEGEEPVVHARRLEAALIGGWIGISELHVGRELRSSPIELRGLSLAQLVALHKQEYIEAEGSIDATIPLTHTALGFSVVGGSLSSVGGGWIKYHGTPPSSESEQSALTVTQRALREYRFTSLAAQIGYAADGTLTIAAQLRGSSPALNTERPVHVNLTLEENLLELFKSLQIANDIEQQLRELR